MLLEVVRALVRRWYIVLMGLLLTGGLVLGAYSSSPPTYHARGLVLLLPSEAAVGKGGNPFLVLSGLEQPAGILVAFFSSAPAEAEVKRLSPTAEYQVGIDDSTRGPVIVVDVSAKSTEETLATMRHLMSQLPEELARLQRQVSAPADATIGSMTLTVDQKAQIDRSGTLRVTIAALVLGLVGTCMSAFALDSFLQRRKRNSYRLDNEEPEMETEQRKGGRRRASPSHAAPSKRTVQREAEMSRSFQAEDSADTELLVVDGSVDTLLGPRS